MKKVLPRRIGPPATPPNWLRWKSPSGCPARFAK
jgi:hypothetical protein